MEVYSTVLWHMKRDADLSFLAQEMVAIDRMAPQVRLRPGFRDSLCVAVLSELGGGGGCRQAPVISIVRLHYIHRPRLCGMWVAICI